MFCWLCLWQHSTNETGLILTFHAKLDNRLSRPVHENNILFRLESGLSVQNFSNEFGRFA
jgi:hypothetical protein